MVEVPRANASFCGPCFTEHYVRNLVVRAIRHDSMFGHTDRILVAVSGGKDSLMLWDVLLDLGYDVAGLYLGLGIGGYSSRSQQVCQDFADARDGQAAHPRPGGVRGLHRSRRRPHQGTRPACAVCGLSKRNAVQPGRA